MKTIKPPFVRNPYNYDTNAASKETAITCPEPTLTQQQFAEESDINFIADRYGLTGELPQVLQLPSYGDFTGIFDFQTAQHQVIQARNQFMTLPAKLRTRFENDPQKLLQFLADPDNRAEAEFLGIVTKKEPHDAKSRTPETPDQSPQAGARPPRARKAQDEAPPVQEPGPKDAKGDR